MQAILTANGYDVLMAGTGAMANTMIASHCPDIIILDLGLPDMDGSEIIRSVRSWSRMPIIIISARSAEIDKASALDMGADDYLTKPFGTVELLARIREEKLPCILCINKIDTVERKDDLLAVIAAYSEVYPDFDAIIPISARTGDGLEDLLTQMQRYAVEGPQLFPDGMTTDQPDQQVCAEIIREKMLLCLDKEIPHGTAVEVTRFTEREDSGIIDLDVTIYCEKASHKGIIIGKHGDMLKRISTLARQDIEKFMGTKVYLETWVKVKENWRDNVNFIRSQGYNEQ